MYTLIYKCTLYNWYERPQMHQILNTLNELKLSELKNQSESAQNAEGFLRPLNQEEILTELIENKKLQNLNAIMAFCNNDKKA